MPAPLSCAEHLSGCFGGIGPCWILPFPSHHPSSRECEIISFLAQIGAAEGTPPSLRQGWEEPGWFLCYFEWESGGYQNGFFTLGGVLGTAGVSLPPIFFLSCCLCSLQKTACSRALPWESGMRLSRRGREQLMDGPGAGVNALLDDPGQSLCFLCSPLAKKV